MQKFGLKLAGPKPLAAAKRRRPGNLQSFFKTHGLDGLALTDEAWAAKSESRTTTVKSDKQSVLCDVCLDPVVKTVACSGGKACTQERERERQRVR